MDKLCIITGGSRGIGAAIARAMFAAGYRIAIIYRNSNGSVANIIAEAAVSGRDVRGFSVDVADSIELAATFARINREMGHCSVLINNAGVAHSGLLMDMDYADWTELLSVNCGSCFTAVRAVLPQMLALGKGSIVNIASIWASHGSACEVAYSASKAAIVGLTRSLAREVGGNNIRVNSISPGFITTDMTASYTDSEIADIVSETPLGRVGQPQDVAELALFLASSKSSFITGQDIVIDGGWKV